MIAWMFDSPQRLKITAAGLAVLVVVLFVVLTLSRLPAPAADPLPSPAVTVEPTPETTATALLPPSPAPNKASPLQDYGPSGPIALEAVQAFLTGDHAKFARLAQEDVVADVNDAPEPPPGQQITGNVETIKGGPTRQRVQVPTTDGPLVLEMVVVDGAWKVLAMEYRR